MPAKKKKHRAHVVDDSSILAARNLAKDLVIRAYFARREKERGGLKGKIRSLFSKKKRAPIIDIFSHVERN